MTAREIIAEWLKEHGYDGLCNGECWCVFDDFAPCDEGPYPDCKAAYRHEKSHLINAGTDYEEMLPPGHFDTEKEE